MLAGVGQALGDREVDRRLHRRGRPPDEPVTQSDRQGTANRQRRHRARQAAVGEHRQLDPRRTAVVEERLDRGADGPAGEEDIVDDDDGRPVEREVRCDRAQQVRVAELRRRFVDGPVLTMPAGGSGTSDTTGSVGIPGVGTVLFRNFTLSAQWGRLTADGGVLRAVGGATLSVPVTGALEGTTLLGDGWSVTLNAGWLVQPAARPGSFTIVREK